MRTGYSVEVSTNGDTPVIDRASTTPDPARIPSPSVAEKKAAALEMEAEQVLRVAREEAKRVRTDARNRVAEMKTDALRERIEYRAAAEKQLANLRKQAERDAEAIRGGATDQLERIRAGAEGEAAAIVEAAEVQAAETAVRTETAVAGMVEDAHRLAAQIVDAAQLEADGIVAAAGKRIGTLDETARDLVEAIAEMKERFETSESIPEDEPVTTTEGQPFLMDAAGDVVAVHGEEVVEPYHVPAEIIAFVAEQADGPRRRWFQIFRRA